ncbi:MAG TPA: molybdenum cofactor biosynthesis protein MoaE [Clostridia bacterium]|nr:molybdenum cofactor biosynthesis protein MoaE [Clostridia bacterium]
MHEGTMKEASPSIDVWLREAKSAPNSSQSGMFLIHNGVVRQTPKSYAREGIDDGSLVTGMDFTYDAVKVDAAIVKTRGMKGINYVRVWLNNGHLKVGDDMMCVLIGGDIRTNVANAMEYLVGKIKNDCVDEIEIRQVIPNNL